MPGQQLRILDFWAWHHRPKVWRDLIPSLGMNSFELFLVGSVWILLVILGLESAVGLLAQCEIQAAPALDLLHLGSSMLVRSSIHMGLATLAPDSMQPGFFSSLQSLS